MSSNEDSTISDTPVSVSDAESKVLQALPRPSELTSGAVIVTAQEIHAEIRLVFQDDDVWAGVLKTLEPQGTEGSAQYDHHFVATYVKAHSEKLQQIKGLNTFSLWRHIQLVLRAKPFYYIMERGYLIGRQDTANSA
jgi:hypothetical protein